MRVRENNRLPLPQMFCWYALSCTYPFKPGDPLLHSPDCSPYTSHENGGGNLVSHQTVLPLVTKLVIVTSSTLHNQLMLLGENGCWSLLGPKWFLEDVVRICVFHTLSVKSC